MTNPKHSVPSASKPADVEEVALTDPKRSAQPTPKPVDVVEVALQLFVEMYKPPETGGRNPEYWAKAAFEAADVFVSVADSRKPKD